MGNLLRLLTRPDSDDSHEFDIFLEFENTIPSYAEKEVFDTVAGVLQNAPALLSELQNYKGASKEIKKAISSPNDDELQDKAWIAVCPLVNKLKHFYESSQEIDSIFPGLLYSLSSSDMTPVEHLEAQQSSAKQFAEVLDFALKFDDFKMTNPNIQNDFSYYRRTLSRRKMANQDDGGDQMCQVSNEMANRMSLFYALPSPMLKTLCDATIKFVTENKNIPLENITDLLSTMNNLCRVILQNSEYYSHFQNDETLLFVLRVMVGLVVLYDHTHPVGAFAKTASIDVKSCITLLRDQTHIKVEGILNALRYTTKHLNDETTPNAIRSMLTS